MANRTAVVPIDGLAEALVSVLKEAGKENYDRVDRALVLTTQERLGAVVTGTPEGTGKAAGNWIFTKNKPSSSLFANGKKKARVQELIKRSDRGMLGATWYFVNNSPYIGKLEFGGYPNPVKTGTWNKEKRKFEIRSIRGYSKQAPQGMLRINLLTFTSTFKAVFKAL